MGQRNGLCYLQVGEARHDRINMRFRQSQQSLLQKTQLLAYMIDGFTQVQPDISRHLIIA